jgi:hypothetical protein
LLGSVHIQGPQQNVLDSDNFVDDDGGGADDIKVMESSVSDRDNGSPPVA